MKNIIFVILFSLLCNLNAYAEQSNDAKSSDSCNQEIVEQDVRYDISRPPHFNLPLEVEQKVQQEFEDEDGLFKTDQEKD